MAPPVVGRTLGVGGEMAEEETDVRAGWVVGRCRRKRGRNNDAGVGPAGGRNLVAIDGDATVDRSVEVGTRDGDVESRGGLGLGWGWKMLKKS